MKIPGQIIDSLFDRKCLFFIGAGMSIAAGLPSTNDICKKLKLKIEADGNICKNEGLDKISGDFVNIYGRPKLLDFVRATFLEKTDSLNMKAHNLLSNLSHKPTDIVTTNWDSLIEESLGKKNYVPIFNNNSVGNYQNNKINLFKIHGDLEHNIVITEDDYLNYKENWKRILIKLKSLMQERTIVFIGYSTDDFNFLETNIEILNITEVENLFPRYCVIPSIDEVTQEKLRKRQIRPIQMNVIQFLEIMEKAISEKISEYKLPSPKTVPEIPTTDYNPFGLFRAEDVEKADWINETFVEPIDFASIMAPGNVIIEGHRGSGKTMILRYMSYPLMLQRESDPNYVGIYVKLQNSLVDVAKREKMSLEDWKKFFINYINLIFGEAILFTIRDLQKSNSIIIDDEGELVQRIIFTFFPDMDINNINNVRKLLDLFTRERNMCVNKKDLNRCYLSAHSLYDFINIVDEHVGQWSNKYYYILMDEYDKLDDDQQKVVNLYLADRGSSLRYKICFKIGVKLFGMNYLTIDNQMLDLIDDYIWIPVDRFDDRKQGEFINKLKEIALRRLNLYGYDNKTLDEIFPAADLGFIKGDYSGINNILLLSSYLIRDFLELIKDMTYYAHPWITSEKRNLIPEISPDIQNFVIKVHSNIMYNTKINEIPGKIGNFERKYLSKALIERMGLIFQNVLKGSKSIETRSISSFQIRNEINLNQYSIAALDDCRSVGAIQVPYTSRAPQNSSRHAPHTKYEFHRILCPQFKLSLGRRWPREIDASDVNQLLDNNNYVKDFTFYFITNIFIKEFIEELFETENGSKLINIYKKNIVDSNINKKLFGKFGKVSEYKDLHNNYILKMGNDEIKFNTQEELNYAKIFVNIGIKEVKIPDKLNMLIVSELKNVIFEINTILNDKILEEEILKKRKKVVIQKFWEDILNELRNNNV